MIHGGNDAVATAFSGKIAVQGPVDFQAPVLDIGLEVKWIQSGSLHSEGEGGSTSGA